MDRYDSASMASFRSDDEIPQPDGPAVRVRGDAFGDADDGRCHECPKLDPERSWCPVRAMSRAGASPMCRYGKALVAAGRKEEP